MGICPLFAALSYTWSHEKGTNMIICEGKCLSVTMSLWRLLYRFATLPSVQIPLLWIDAICIDQNNIEERSHQVGQMRDIYSKAERVLAWLGEADDESELTFTMLRNIDQGTHNRLIIDWTKEYGARHWAALSRLLDRPYWQRLWIIQEFILA
ncbi:heterokaryon incompatibility, partial [Lophiotrema nucula]